MASTAPSLDFGLPVARPLERCSSGFDRIEGIGLATAASLVTVGTIHFDHGDAHSAQVAGQAGPIGASALHADLGDVAERAQPLEQGLVAGWVGAEGLRAEQSTERVQGGGDMEVTMGVDTTGHTTRSFYDGHGHPFLSKV